MPIPASLQTLLLQFQNRYPLGGLCAELLTIHQDQYVVRALVQVGNMTVASAMAAAADLEAAEEQAKVRVLECLGLAPLSGLPPTLHVPSLSIPEAALQAGGQTSASQPSGLVPGAGPNPIPNAAAWSRLPASHESPEAVVASPKTASLETAGPPMTGVTGPVPPPTQLTPVQPTSPRSANVDSYPSRLDATLPALSAPEAEQMEQTKPAVGAVQLADLPASNPTASSSTAAIEPDDMSGSRAKSEKAVSKRKSEPMVEPVVSTASVDRSQEVMRIGIEMKRLGWSTEQGREYLKRTYGKRSRQELDDAELLDFLHYLESQPSTLQAPF